MSARKRTPLYHWEQELIDAYHDYQWHLTLDPLYEKFQSWKTGEVSHLEMDKAIHETHKECQKVYSLFTSKRSFLVDVIELNKDWFPRWLLDHPKPIE